MSPFVVHRGLLGALSGMTNLPLWAYGPQTGNVSCRQTCAVPSLLSPAVLFYKDLAWWGGSEQEQDEISFLCKLADALYKMQV